MKGIVCKVCGHVVLSGNMPQECPVCHSPKSAFSASDTAIKDPVDRANMQDSEKKHTPDIRIVKQCSLIPGGCIDAHVRVGIQLLHPMTPEHFIGWLDFYLNKTFVGRMMLKPAINPAGAVHLKNDAAGTLTAVAWCNQHGTWLNEVKI